MAILDHTVVNVALPTLGRVFQAELGLLQWVITGYALAQAAVIPLAGWLSDRFGAKRVYISAVGLFTLGSVLCAAAPSALGLVAFRVLQGLGGGVLMPIGMAFVFRLAPPDKRGAVMGVFGIPIMLAPALGPALSGWLVEFADWRLIFLINVPVGMFALALAARVLPRLAAQRVVGRLDLLGVILAPLAFGTLTFGIGQSYGAGWTGASRLLALGVGLVALVAFVARELKTDEPLLDLRVFRVGVFSRGILVQWLTASGMFGSMFLLPVFLQQVAGYGSFQTGMATLPHAIVAGLAMPVGGRLFDRFGARPTVLTGLALVATGLALLSRISPATTPMELILPLALWGGGMGMAMMPLNTHLLNSAPRDLVSRVTSLTSAFHSVVIALGVAVAATFVQVRLAARAAEVGLSPRVAAQAFDDTFLLATSAVLLALALATTLSRPAAALATHPEEVRAAA
jgi:EmrB/QacA subfamily drug resistance transporter